MDSKAFRTHFFAPNKVLFGMKIQTELLESLIESFQALLVFIPYQLVDANGCLLLELVKARSEQFGVDMMKQGGELELAASVSRLTPTEQPMTLEEIPTRACV